MRRLLALALLCAGAAVPAHAHAVPVPGWLARQQAALARESLVPGLFARYREAAAAGESTLTSIFAGPDLDHDGVADLVTYVTSWSETADHLVHGTTTTATTSGRTGAALRVTVVAAPLAVPMTAKVGAQGVAGLLLVGATEPTVGTNEIRVVAQEGKRVVYNRTVTSTDGLGQVEWGGTFDGIRGGGTDAVLARRLSAAAPQVPAPGTPSHLQAVVLNGADGTVADFGAPDVGLGGGYFAAGDLDKDGRDDVVLVRYGPTGVRGSVTALSSATGAPIWANADAPVGSVSFGGLRGYDVVGDARADVVLVEWFGVGKAPDPAPSSLGPVTLGASAGTHVVVLDGATGALGWDRWVSANSGVWGVARLGKARELVTYGVVPVAGGWALRFSAVNATGRDRYHRDVKVDGRSDDEAYGAAWTAGDLDADGVVDLGFIVIVVRGGQALVDAATGLLLAGHGTTRAYAPTLGASLDGRGADIYRYTADQSGARIDTFDGLTGKRYWHATVNARAGAGAVGLQGAHGCASVAVLVVQWGGGLWAAGLDPHSGRTRWTRALTGAAPPGLRVRSGGRTATCH